MAIRTDIFSVDWSTSPRLIWIDIAFTEVSAQDLYDTCKYLEFLPSGMDEPPLCDAGGWEPLGLGVYVGITVSLFNAQYAFADRPGPDWVICNMTGGNVAAFEDATRQVEIYPRYPTAYVSADRTASSSATTKEQADIEYSSFNGGVTFDDVNGYDGTGYAPNGAAIGTQRAPSGNVYDARTIAETRGFAHGYITNDMDVPVYELDGFTPFEIQGFTFVGSGKDRTEVTIPEDALVYDCTYMDCHAQGYLDGNNTLLDCLIDNLYYIKGYIESCVLAPGIITLGGNDTAHFLDCFSGVPGTGTPTIDMGGSGQPLALRNYNGGIKLINKTGPESVSIDLNSGQIKIDMTTVTNGVIVCRGVGKLIDADTEAHIHTGTYGSLVIINELVNVPKITKGVWGEDLTTHQIPGSAGDDLSNVATNVWDAEVALQVLSAINFIKNIEGGRWKIIDNQMLFYAEDNITEVARFDLFDKDGIPDDHDVYERRLVTRTADSTDYTSDMTTITVDTE